VIIIVQFQLYVRKVIVLAVSRELYVFHVDNMWTSTRGWGVCIMGTPVDRRRGRHKWMTP